MADAVRVYVNIGSNVERETHIRSALALLHSRYGALIVSSVYESDPVGFQGDRFYNLAVGFDTDDGAATIVRELHTIEAQCGRVRTGCRFNARTLDLDLLLYGDQVLQIDRLTIPRDEILTQGHVLGPLAEIAGNLQHPVENRTFAEIWGEFHATDRIWTVDVHLSPMPAGA